MPVVNSKPRKTAKKPVVTKMCLHCHNTRNLSDFYSNRDWIAQAGKDVWCKKCISQIKTKDEMRQYFFENNRQWNERIWENAKKKALQLASKNPVFQKSSDDRKELLLEAITCQQVPSIMQIHYSYIDNTQDININSYEEAKEAGKVVELDSYKQQSVRRDEDNGSKQDPNLKTYDPFFNGDFKPSELQYLREFFDGIDEGYDLSDTTMEDAVKKVAKAALTADKMQNDFLAGRCSGQDVASAINNYDLLMKSSNLAVCKRKPGEKGNMSSWAEITQYCETNGHPCIKKIDWPSDVVDVALDGLGYIIESMRDENYSAPEESGE